MFHWTYGERPRESITGKIMARDKAIVWEITMSVRAFAIRVVKHLKLRLTARAAI